MVDTLAGRLGEMHIETLGETLVEVEVKVSMYTLFETRQETLTQVKSEVLFGKLAKKVSKLRIRQLVLASKLADKKVQKFLYTLAKK